MEVILREDFPALGYVGDRVKVRPGYARNFLLPRGIALEISRRNTKMMDHLLSGIAAKRKKLKRLAEEQGGEVAKIVLEFALRIGKRGKSFGSITARDIEHQLSAKGFACDRKRIRLPEPIKRAGEFKVELHLHSEVTVPIMVVVKAEESNEKTEETEVPAPSENGAGLSEALEESNPNEEIH